MLISIGLMSGTSMDGIDAALIETDGSTKIKALGSASISYDPLFKVLLKASEYSIRKHTGDLHRAKFYFLNALEDYLSFDLQLSKTQVENKISELNGYLPVDLDAVIQHSTDLHYQAVKSLLKKTGYKAEQIDVIGYHGQTMFHRPSDKISVVVGDGHYLANKLKITVINDFRSRDIAAGGHGAPFAPLFHYALARRDRKIPLAIVNCGGIANISLINSENESDIVAFDTGPGNGLIDRLVRQRTNGKALIDCNGQFGLKGRVNSELLKLLYQTSLNKNDENYFSLPPPKSLDIADMKLIPELQSLSLEDACATLEAFTADSIIQGLEWLNGFECPKEWVLAGGGWNNPVIKLEFENRLRRKYGTEINIYTADEVGWHSQAMEAQIFAYLAVRSLQNKSLSLPSTTGVPIPMSGGRICIPDGGANAAVQQLMQANSSHLEM